MTTEREPSPIEAAAEAFLDAVSPEPEAWMETVDVRAGVRAAIATYLRARAEHGDVPAAVLHRLAAELDATPQTHERKP